MPPSKTNKPAYNRRDYAAKMAARRERQREKEEARRIERARYLIPDTIEFADQLYANTDRLRKYISNSRYVKSDKMRAMLLKEMLPSDAPFLAANNPDARMRFQCAWSPHVSNFVYNRKAYFVSLTPKQYALPLSRAGEFNMDSLKSWARFELLGFDFVGIVEAGHHSHVYPITNLEPWISFHVHAIVLADDVGICRKSNDIRALRERVSQIKEKYFAFRPGAKSADIEPVYDIGYLTRYVVKEPNTDYRIPVARLNTPELNDDAIPAQPGRRPVKKVKRKTLSPGPQLKILATTRLWHLDKMIFGGGTGVPVIEKIREDALGALPWKMRARRQHEYSGCFEPGPEKVQGERYSGWLHHMNRYEATNRPQPKLEKRKAKRSVGWGT